ncbi:MAG: octanoyltransferase [Rickettsiales bacterium]|nr:octanoyltransferase [Rickettsiales bacterium]
MNSLEVKQTDKFINYELALSDMQNRVDQIITKSKNEMIWFLNHNHIYTQGTSSSDQEILKKNNVPILKTNRGGKTTYHGPGQRIVYFMIDLNKRNKDLRKFISLIENSLINILYKYHIESTTFKNRVGIWVIKNQGKTLDKEKKIGAIGLRIKKWITYHGLSFNIKTNLKYYDYINSCGLLEYKNTSLENLGIDISVSDFDKEYLAEFKKNLKNL